jgi:DNA-binding NarL/FixJ family response regulator
VESLRELWPDPDRRHDALVRLAVNVHEAEFPDYLTPQQARVLEAMSRGLNRHETAELLGISVESTKTHLKLATRALRAKTTTHACCEALRRGLIR